MGAPGATDQRDQRLVVAYESYVRWLATPAVSRTAQLATVSAFCSEFNVNLQDLAGFAAEDDFVDDVVACNTHWVELAPSVIEQIRRNAEDGTRKDQMTWMVAYLRIAGHPGGRLLNDLLPSN